MKSLETGKKIKESLKKFIVKMNTLRSFYSNVLYTKATNYLTVPDGSNGDGGTSASAKEKKRRKSSKSLSNISDNFIRAVENMESVVLIPTKLLDIPVAGDMTIPDLISSGHSNLYDIYKSIKGFKDKLTSLNVTDDDEEESDDGPNSAVTFDVDDIIANLTASLNEQGLINNNNNNNNEKDEMVMVKARINSNNNLVSLNAGQIVTGQVINVPSVTITTGLKSVPSNSSMSNPGESGNNGGKGIESGQTGVDSLSGYCDSGVWSSEGGGSSRDSIDDVSEECISFANDPSGNSSPSGRLSVEPNEARSRKASANRSHYGLQSVQYHRQQIMSAASKYVVKKSLSSAKGFCSFLIELTQVTESVITKYMEEIECHDVEK